MDDNIVKDLCFPIFQARGWIKFLGVLAIISGILSGLTVIGLLFCWLPIWLGILLFGSASKIEAAFYSGDHQQAIDAFANIKKFFVISGIISLISIVFSIGSVMLFSSAIFASLGQFL